MSEPGDLVPLYLDSDATCVRIVGGPHDGQLVKLSSSKPLDRLFMLVDPGPPTLVDTSEPLVPFTKAAYRPRLDAYGQPSRDDDGTLVYEHDGKEPA